MSLQHHELAAGRWNDLTLMEQLGNIGSEVERTLRWKEKGNQHYATRAMDRTLELFALTLACPGNKSRLREIARARELFLDYLLGGNEFQSTGESLRRYFLPFAIATRKVHDVQRQKR